MDPGNEQFKKAYIIVHRDELIDETNAKIKKATEERDLALMNEAMEKVIELGMEGPEIDAAKALRYELEASEEEFGHAREISKYQTLRGGRVELAGVKKPATHEFAATEFKSDALVAFEAALEASLLLARFASADETSFMPPPPPRAFALAQLEKRVYQSLLELSQLASDVNDPQLGDYLDGFLKEQVRRRAQCAYSRGLSR